MFLRSERARKKLCLLLLLFCCLAVVQALLAVLMVVRGDVLIERVDGATVLLNGEAPHAAGKNHIALPESIHVFMQEGAEVDPALYAGVCAIGLTRYLSLLVFFAAMLRLVYNVYHGCVLDAGNTRLLFACGVFLLARAVLLPLINALIIPALVNGASRVQLHIGINPTMDSWLLTGIALLLLAQISYKENTRLKSVKPPRLYLKAS